MRRTGVLMPSLCGLWQDMPRVPSWSVAKFFQPSESQIDPETLEKLAKRAQLRIPPEKEDSLCEDVSKILSCVRIIGEVNTDGVEPLISPLDARQVSLRMRDDAVTEGQIAEKLLENAPESDGSFFVVPKVKNHSGN